jgi:acyl-coenzyme A thioesterase 13
MAMDDSFDISQITGNASDDIKRTVCNPGPGGFFHLNSEFSMFGGSILKRMKVLEISFNRKAEEEKKMEARVVVELDVTEGQYTMLNP